MTPADTARPCEASIGQVYNVAGPLQRAGYWTSEQEKGYRVRPCRWCGCIEFLPMRIDEPVGAVCAGCRRDRNGAVWPSDPYDRYVAHADLRTLARSSRDVW